LNAALLCAQLEKINHILSKKRDLATKYKTFFDSIDLKLKWEGQHSNANFWLMCLEMETKADRDHFLEESNHSGIMTRPAWRLMHKLPMFKNCLKDNQEHSEYLADRIVNIPSSVR
jgi:dTDP-4-amino-4,6-dideoxygalactose transaminase